MATMTLTSSYKSSMEIQLTYEVSPGQFKLTAIKGRRTDGYLTQSYNASGGEMIYVTVGGTQKTFNSTGIYFTNTSSSWSDAWANCSGTWTGLSGTESIYITLDSTQSVTNIDKSTFSGSVYVTPPASTITNNTSSSSRIDFGSDVTFSITRPTDSTTHTLTYTVGGTTYTIGTGITTSKTYSFPTSLISNYTSGTTANITVNCANSNGSSSTTTVYLKVPDSYVPTVDMSLSTSSFFPDGWAGNTLVLGPQVLKGLGTMDVAVTASGVSGSTIASYSVNVENVGTFDKSSFNTGILKTAGRQYVYATVKDSRGRTATVEKEFYVVDYTAPYITNLKAIRCDASGNATEEGTYAKLTFDYKVDPGDTDTNYFYISAECNGTSVTLFDGEDTNNEGSYTSGAIFSGLSTDLSYSVTVTLTDSVYGAELPELAYTTSVSPSAVTLSKLAGGKGITFGQTATEEGLHSYMTATFHNKVYIKNTESGVEYLREIRDLIYPIGTIYISTGTTSPAALFGGTWTQLKDKFLIGAGNSYTLGGEDGSLTTSGSSAANSGSTVLTAAQSGVPQHTHSYSQRAAAIYTTTYASSASTLVIRGSSGFSLDHGNQSLKGNYQYGAAASSTSGKNTAANASSGHTHTIAHTHTYLPPLLAVNMWKRTA